MLRRTVALSTRRGLHTSATLYFKQKTAETKSKFWTPKKKSGEWRNFRRAAGYSNYQKFAPQLAKDDVLTTELSKDNLSSLEGLVSFPAGVRAALTHASSFKPTQNNELFAAPAALVRTESHRLAQALSSAATEGSAKHRFLLRGPPGIGKSTLLAQAQAHAKINGWVLLHMPRPITLVDGSSSAVVTQSGRFMQPALAHQWVKKVIRANKELLGGEVALKNALYPGKSAQNAVPDPIGALISTLEKLDVPVLLTLDGLNAWTQLPYSRNRDTDNQPIYHGDLQLPALFLDYISGRKTFKKGAVVGATSGEFAESKTFDVAFGLASSHAYAGIEEYDDRLAAAIKTVEPINVSYFTPEETELYMKYLAAVGVLPTADVTREVRDEYYALSGNGNPRAILKKCVNYSF